MMTVMNFLVGWASSKMNWLKLGDSNTIYFSLSTNMSNQKRYTQGSNGEGRVVV